MNNWEKLRLVCQGGHVSFVCNSSDPHGVEIPRVIFKKYVPFSVAVFIIALLSPPLLFVQSPLGLIEFKDGEMLQYHVNLFNGLVIAVQAFSGVDAVYPLDIPVPVNHGWKVAINFAFLVASAILVALVCYILFAIVSNFKTLGNRHGELSSPILKKEVAYGRILPTLPGCQ